MALSTATILSQLQTLQRRRRAVLGRLLHTDELAVGTVSWVERRCGRPGCHCAQGSGHRQLQFLFADADGRRRCKVIRRTDEARLEEANQRYRAYRQDLRELAAIQKRERQLLMALVHARELAYE